LGRNIPQRIDDSLKNIPVKIKIQILGNACMALRGFIF